MKNILIPLISLFCFSITAQAKTVYVTDNTQYTLRSSESTRSKIIKMLPTGTELTLLSEDKNTGYSRVRTTKGSEGYILTRYTLDKPISKWYLDKANKELETLQQENDLLKKELIQLKSSGNTTVNPDQSLIQNHDKLSSELMEIRKTAANAIQIKRQRDQLQERVISAERELQQVKRENQTLENSTNQDWFLYGGIISLLGVVLGVILPKLSWRRKSSSSWDTF